MYDNKDRTVRSQHFCKDDPLQKEKPVSLRCIDGWSRTAPLYGHSSCGTCRDDASLAFPGFGVSLPGAVDLPVANNDPQQNCFYDLRIQLHAVCRKQLCSNILYYANS
nr:hypothetical protein CFP56_03215 [Quercus suber]